MKYTKRMYEPHNCRVCGVALVPNPKEYPSQFNSRVRCPDCKGIATYHSAGEYKLRNCEICDKPMVPKKGERPSEYNVRQTCGKVCGVALSVKTRGNKDRVKVAKTKVRKKKEEKENPLARLKAAHEFMKGLSFR